MLGVADFADIIKIVITLIKTTFISSIMVKKNTNYVVKSNFYMHFLM